MASIRAPRSAFTLIELLVVIAIIAILAVVVVLVLNPAELLKQARDANRLSDLSTLNNAINLYTTDQSQTQSFSLGNASSVYVSLPDTSPTCSDLGLPALPSGYAYHCASSTSTRNTDGLGWIPVDFQNVSAGSPLGALPVDPINQSSTALYYTYSTDGTRFQIVTALPESTKQKTILDQTPLITGYPGVMAQGSSLSVSPLYSTSGLVGWWPLNEGSGTIVYDQSGNGNNGTLSGATYTSGRKAGDYSLRFYGTNSYVSLGNSPTLNPAVFTINAWINNASSSNWYGFIYSNARDCCSTYNGINLVLSNGQALTEIWNSSFNASQGGDPISTGVWHMMTGTYDGSTIRTYINGTLIASAAYSAGVGQPASFGSYIGAMGAGPNNFDLIGTLNDVRLYDRALSPAEIMALYNAEE